MKWTADQIPDQTGRTAIVTGANAGIGYETARALAHRGARVILACRSRERGEAAVARIRGEGAEVELALLDLASLASVRAFAQAFLESGAALHLLINNAGVMIPPASKTEDGFELQIGVNYLGHHALTGLLLSRLLETPGARVVTVSSLAHRQGRIDLGSFHGERPYKGWREYCQSKLACLVFTLELQRRLEASGAGVISVAAHPGGTKTDLQRHNKLLDVFTTIAAMSAPKGALPTLYAATAPDVAGGAYFGPRGPYELIGYPAPAHIARRAQDAEVARALWETAEKLTGVRYLS
ncbi:MAG: short-chain dehydrogenase [Myxococcales bacterium]